MSDAQAIYQRENSGRFNLTIGFDKAVPIRDQNALANEIADLATRIERHETGQVRRDVFFSDIPELSFVWLRSGDSGDSFWRVQQVYSGSMMSLERLKDIIKEKEEKSQEYKPCEAYWLLVVVDFFDRAQDQEIHIEGLDTIRSEVFEKIIVYKTAFGQILETSGQSAKFATRSCRSLDSDGLS